MEDLRKKLGKLRFWCLGFFPRALPVGQLALSDYCGTLFQVYSLPDLPSYRHAVASMIMHLGPTVDKKAPYFFVKSIRKAMANQVAYALIEELRELDKKQKSEASQVETPLAHEEETKH